jgi:hypothetical protein
MSTQQIEKRLRIAGILIGTGLAVEGVSLIWTHPLSFIVFLGACGILLGAGLLMFLVTLIRTS